MNNVVFGCYHPEDITGLYSLIKLLEMKCQGELTCVRRGSHIKAADSLKAVLAELEVDIR